MEADKSERVNMAAEYQKVFTAPLEMGRTWSSTYTLELQTVLSIV